MINPNPHEQSHGNHGNHAVVLTSDQVLAGHLFLLHVGDRQPDTLQHPRAAQQLFRRSSGVPLMLNLQAVSTAWLVDTLSGSDRDTVPDVPTMEWNWLVLYSDLYILLSTAVFIAFILPQWPPKIGGFCGLVVTLRNHDEPWILVMFGLDSSFGTPEMDGKGCSTLLDEWYYLIFQVIYGWYHIIIYDYPNMIIDLYQQLFR